jgi:hypothetical protein
MSDREKVGVREGHRVGVLGAVEAEGCVIIVDK